MLQECIRFYFAGNSLQLLLFTAPLKVVLRLLYFMFMIEIDVL